jgi:transposase
VPCAGGRCAVETHQVVDEQKQAADRVVNSRGDSTKSRTLATASAKLRSIAQSRTEPTSRVERARILLAYREGPLFFAIVRALGLHHQTVQRCVERAVAEGPMAAIDDRPRPGREPTITLEAKAWLVSPACREAKDLGYPHELWTTRLLARHAREHGPAQGHACLANLAQGTVCRILDQEEVKPHKVRYYLEQRDPDFAEKMAEVLCVYRQVKILKQAAAVQSSCAYLQYSIDTLIKSKAYNYDNEAISKIQAKTLMDNRHKSPTAEPPMR